MNQKNLMQSLLTQAMGLMETFQKSTGLNEITPEIVKQIEEVQKNLIYFNEKAKQHLASSSLDPKTIRIDAMQSGHLSSKEQRNYERLTQANRDTRLLKAEIDKLISKRQRKKEVTKKAAEKPGKSRKTSLTTKEQVKQRKKRFKPIGGDKNWIPL